MSGTKRYRRRGLISSIKKGAKNSGCPLLEVKGTYISNSINSENSLKSIKVEAIDSTGAGDAFVGAFFISFGKKNKMNIKDFEIIKKNAFMKLIKIAASVCTKNGSHGSSLILLEKTLNL